MKLDVCQNRSLIIPGHPDLHNKIGEAVAKYMRENIKHIDKFTIIKDNTIPENEIHAIDSRGVRHKILNIVED